MIRRRRRKRGKIEGECEEENCKVEREKIQIRNVTVELGKGMSRMEDHHTEDMVIEENPDKELPDMTDKGSIALQARENCG